MAHTVSHITIDYYRHKITIIIDYKLCIIITAHTVYHIVHIITIYYQLIIMPPKHDIVKKLGGSRRNRQPIASNITQLDHTLENLRKQLQVYQNKEKRLKEKEAELNKKDACQKERQEQSLLLKAKAIQLEENINDLEDLNKNLQLRLIATGNTSHTKTKPFSQDTAGKTDDHTEMLKQLCTVITASLLASIANNQQSLVRNDQKHRGTHI